MTYFHYNVDGESKELRIVCDAEAKGAAQAFKALGYHTKATNKNILAYEIHVFLEHANEKARREREEIATIIQRHVAPIDFPKPRFEYIAEELQKAGFHKVEGSEE